MGWILIMVRCRTHLVVAPEPNDAKFTINARRIVKTNLAESRTIFGRRYFFVSVTGFLSLEHAAI